MLSSPIQSIFISYTPVDGNFVNRLAADLRARNFRVWVDNRQIHGSQIEQAIDSCQALLVVLSPDAVNSQWVQNEYHYGLSFSKLVIPIRYRPCRIPLELNNIQWVDFQINYARGFNDLLSTLKSGESSGTLTLPSPIQQPSISPKEAAKREKVRKIRAFPAIVLGATRASTLGFIGLSLALSKVVVLGIIGAVIGIAAGIAIEIAEETSRRKETLTTPMRILRVIGGGGIRVIAAVVIGVFLGSLSNSTAIRVIGGVIGGAIGILSEVAERPNWSTKALAITMGIVRVILEGVIGLVGGLSIGLDIALIYVIVTASQFRVTTRSCSNLGDCFGKAIGGALETAIGIVVIIFVISLFGALIGAILGLIAGAIVEIEREP